MPSGPQATSAPKKYFKKKKTQIYQAETCDEIVIELVNNNEIIPNDHQIIINLYNDMKSITATQKKK